MVSPCDDGDDSPGPEYGRVELTVAFVLGVALNAFCIWKAFDFHPIVLIGCPVGAYLMWISRRLLAGRT